MNVFSRISIFINLKTNSKPGNLKIIVYLFLFHVCMTKTKH